jgi:hypothetical protein
MKYLITYDHLTMLKHAVDLYDQDLESTHCRLISVSGTNEQYDLVSQWRTNLKASLAALQNAFAAQIEGDPEKTGWSLKPVEK